jgi:5-oxopent-3-ene-1,2,5-tricarboxylate decarboxylase/2-hydroxyhepta-2,4-diene-1,7-dioate isomerase
VTVYAAALNFRGSLEALGDLNAEPYKGPPKAPVLYIKTPNTLSVSGAPIRVPAGVSHLKMGGTVGLVMGKGWVVANDVSIPHSSYFRPAIKERCRDGFLVLSPIFFRPADRDAEIRISVNDQTTRASTKDLIRPVTRLIEDITEFMSLNIGDILLVGEPPNAPLAQAGDRVRVEIDGVALENVLEPE